MESSAVLFSSQKYHSSNMIDLIHYACMPEGIKYYPALY